MFRPLTSSSLHQKCHVMLLWRPVTWFILSAPFPTMDWGGAKIIQSRNNRYHHWIKEAVEIRKRAHRTVNQDEGLSCCHTPGMQSSIKPPANRGRHYSRPGRMTNLYKPADRTSQQHHVTLLRKTAGSQQSERVKVQIYFNSLDTRKFQYNPVKQLILQEK